MSSNLKARLARLEGSTDAGALEIIVINSLPDPGEPPTPSAVINRHDTRVDMAEGESVAAFRARCCALAGKGGWVAYALLETCPDYRP
jgi:hypothetical protein